MRRSRIPATELFHGRALWCALTGDDGVNQQGQVCSAMGLALQRDALTGGALQRRRGDALPRARAQTLTGVGLGDLDDVLGLCCRNGCGQRENGCTTHAAGRRNAVDTRATSVARHRSACTRFGAMRLPTHRRGSASWLVVPRRELA